MTNPVPNIAFPKLDKAFTNMYDFMMNDIDPDKAPGKNVAFINQVTSAAAILIAHNSAVQIIPSETAGMADEFIADLEREHNTKFPAEKIAELKAQMIQEQLVYIGRDIMRDAENLRKIIMNGPPDIGLTPPKKRLAAGLIDSVISETRQAIPGIPATPVTFNPGHN